MRFAKNLEFDQDAIEDLAHWVKKDRRKAEKILDLIQEIAKDPFHGTGKPEPLKYDFNWGTPENYFKRSKVPLRSF